MHHRHHINRRFPGKYGLPGPPWFYSSTYSGKEPVWISITRFRRIKCHSDQQSHSIDLNHSLASPFFIHYLTPVHSYIASHTQYSLLYH